MYYTYYSRKIVLFNLISRAIRSLNQSSFESKAPYRAQMILRNVSWANFSVLLAIRAEGGGLLLSSFIPVLFAPFIKRALNNLLLSRIETEAAQTKKKQKRRDRHSGAFI